MRREAVRLFLHVHVVRTTHLQACSEQQPDLAQVDVQAVDKAVGRLLAIVHSRTFSSFLGRALRSGHSRKPRSQRSKPADVSRSRAWNKVGRAFFGTTLSLEGSLVWTPNFHFPCAKPVYSRYMTPTFLGGPRAGPLLKICYPLNLLSIVGGFMYRARD